MINTDIKYTNSQKKNGFNVKLKNKSFSILLEKNYNLLEINAKDIEKDINCTKFAEGKKDVFFR